ncbi:MAG: hypothetical protein BUE48_000250 [Thermomonospora sp. CIF 1]|nr:MAG: hypothetical protein BUE48_000250 [Thermomonospora sp. CIF 1]
MAAELAPELKHALRHLRKVRSRRPCESEGLAAFADWREEMAGALELLARHLLYEEDRAQAAAEAAQARSEAAQIRAQARP